MRRVLRNRHSECPPQRRPIAHKWFTVLTIGSPWTAESKSACFAFLFSGHSEKTDEFSSFPINRLASASECNFASRALVAFPVRAAVGKLNVKYDHVQRHRRPTNIHLAPDAGAPRPPA